MCVYIYIHDHRSSIFRCRSQALPTPADLHRLRTRLKALEDIDGDLGDRGAVEGSARFAQLGPFWMILTTKVKKMLGMCTCSLLIHPTMHRICKLFIFLLVYNYFAVYLTKR